METLGNIDHISELFKITRKFHGLRQVDFAAQLGVRQGTVSKIEAGVMAPDLGVWFMLLKAFKIKDPYCFTYSGLEFGPDVYDLIQVNGSELAPKFEFNQQNQVTVMRKIRPLYEYMLCQEQKALERFLIKEEVDKDIFYILNHPVSYEFLDKFLACLDEKHINSKALPLLKFDFNVAQGRYMEQLKGSRDLVGTLFNYSNEDKDVFHYLKSDTEKKYIVSLDDQVFEKLNSISKANLFIDYNLLYPFHVEKAVKGIAQNPKIEVIKENHKWQISYVA